MHYRQTSGVGLRWRIKRDDNNIISLHKCCSFLSSVSFNLIGFSSPSYLVFFHLPLFPCLYGRLPSYHIFNLSTLLCLLFVPSLMRPLLCSHVWLSMACCLASSFLPAASSPFALFLSHTDSVFYYASLLAGVLALFTYSLSLLPWRYTNLSLSLVTV